MTFTDETLLSRILARTIVSSDERSEYLAFGTPVYCPDRDGVRTGTLTIIKPNAPTTQETDTVSSTQIDVKLVDEFKFKMKIPHDVSLKTDFNLLNIVRSFAYQMFKHEVSNAICEYLSTNSEDFQATDAQTTLSASIGEAYADYVYSGTGSKFSVYKYDNGAPVTYSECGNEVALNKDAIMDKNSIDFAISSFEAMYNNANENTPAYYLIESPTLLLNATTHKMFYQQLADGTFKRTMADKFEVAVNHDTMPENTLGFIGTNNAFAIGFTEPKVEIVPDTKSYQNIVKVYINYGVSAVNTEDIIFISNMTAGG